VVDVEPATVSEPDVSDVVRSPGAAAALVVVAPVSFDDAEGAALTSSHPKAPDALPADTHAIHMTLPRIFACGTHGRSTARECQPDLLSRIRKFQTAKTRVNRI